MLYWLINLQLTFCVYMLQLLKGSRQAKGLQQLLYEVPAYLVQVVTAVNTELFLCMFIVNFWFSSSFSVKFSSLSYLYNLVWSVEGTMFKVDLHIFVFRKHTKCLCHVYLQQRDFCYPYMFYKRITISGLQFHRWAVYVSMESFLPVALFAFDADDSSKARINMVHSAIYTKRKNKIAEVV